MKCPQCKGDFPLTWKRYAKAPLSRMTCPLCRTRLIGTHRWFYWPSMILGCCVIGVPMAFLGGAKYGLAGALMGWIIGALALGVPIDRFLEGKFSVLKVRGDGASNKTSGGGAQ